MPRSESYRLRERRNKTLRRLFDEDRSGPAVLYHAKPGMEDEAAISWIVTGVCMSCHHRAIMVGRCIQCGADPNHA